MMLTIKMLGYRDDKYRIRRIKAAQPYTNYIPHKDIVEYRIQSRQPGLLFNCKNFIVTSK